MVICQGRDLSTQIWYVCLLCLWSKIHYTSPYHSTSPYSSCLLGLSGPCPFHFAGIQQQQQSLPNSSFNRNILHFNSTSIRGIWRDSDAATSKYSNTPWHSSLLLNPSFFSAFIKSSNTKDPCNYIKKSERETLVGACLLVFEPGRITFSILLVSRMMVNPLSAKLRKQSLASQGITQLHIFLHNLLSFQHSGNKSYQQLRKNVCMFRTC